jgi:hypothetical protein
VDIIDLEHTVHFPPEVGREVEPRNLDELVYRVKLRLSGDCKFHIPNSRVNPKSKIQKNGICILSSIATSLIKNPFGRLERKIKVFAQSPSRVLPFSWLLAPDSCP